MKKKVLILVSIFLVIFPSVSFGAITSQFVWSHGFDDSVDGYGIKWNGQISNVSHIKYYNLSTGVNRIDYDDQNTGGIILRCNASFKWEYYGSDGSVLATDSVTVSGVQNPSIEGICSTPSTNPEPEPEPEPEPSCFELLEPILNDILDQLENNGQTISEISNQLSVINITINNIDNTLTIIKNELQTTQNPPTFEKPTNSNLDDYKPNLDLPIYKDDTVYFEDNGQAETAPPMPSIPEPKPWLDEEGLEMDKDIPYAPEEELQQDTELDRDLELEQDTELEIDEFIQDSELNKDNELERDEFTQSTELNKDSELERDEFTQDSELNKDTELEKDEFNQNHQYEQDTEYKQDTPMQQTEEDYRLRWKSVNGVFQP